MPSILDWIRHRQLQIPTVILLESHRPLSFMLGQMLMAAEPLLPGVKSSRLGRAISGWDAADPELVDNAITELVSGDSAQVS